jgi:tetratricopeptide (TPR) repeat protein
MIMKVRLLALALLALGTATLLAFRFNDSKPASAAGREALKKNIVRCGPDWEALQPWLDAVDIPPMPGAGIYKWKISTDNDSAQFYFNQGINMYYGFHIIESMASFKKAARFDPNCAMIHWAQALAYGPNINDVGYSASPEALAANNRAAELASGKITTKEKMLIGSMLSRYSADTTQSRAKLNQVYVDRMKDAYENFPNDPDIAALYADAMMLQHPWDLWNNDGTPKPWTPRIYDVLKKMLAKTPDHPGANHYFIHLMEPSPYSKEALPSADRLGRLTPGLSHMVHMPSHIYLRLGQYQKGAQVNETAVQSYKRSIPLYGAVTGADFLYLIHNLHMQTNQAMTGGQIGYSVKSAKETAASIPKDYLEAGGAMGNYVQYIHMTPMLVDVRFGMWEEALDRNEPPASQVYANVLYRFGRGMAFAGQSKPDDARKELQVLQQLMKDPVLAIPFTPFSPALDGAIVAEHLLIGTIALKERKHGDAIAAFEKAVRTEENMVYNEPRDWLLNPKHYLGKAYLVAARWNDAEKTLKKDLEGNENNVWALKGLQQALQGQMKTKESTKLQSRLNSAAKWADVKIVSPVF